MLSKEELIERMSVAIRHAIHVSRTIHIETPHDVYLEDIADITAAALQALLDSLPNLPMDLVNGIETDARLYRQLLQIKENDQPPTV